MDRITENFNDITTASIIIQNNMKECQTIEELYHIFASWSELIKHLYLSRMKELTGNKENENYD